MKFLRVVVYLGFLSTLVGAEKTDVNICNTLIESVNSTYFSACKVSSTKCAEMLTVNGVSNGTAVVECFGSGVVNCLQCCGCGFSEVFRDIFPGNNCTIPTKFNVCQTPKTENSKPRKKWSTGKIVGITIAGCVIVLAVFVLYDVYTDK